MCLQFNEREVCSHLHTCEWTAGAIYVIPRMTTVCHQLQMITSSATAALRRVEWSKYCDQNSLGMLHDPPIPITLIHKPTRYYYVSLRTYTLLHDENCDIEGTIPNMAHSGNCVNDKGCCNIQRHNGNITSVTHNTRAHWHKNCEIKDKPDVRYAYCCSAQ